MHYVTSCDMVGKKRMENWHYMLFKNDFVETLTKYGRLPIANYKTQLSKIIECEEEI